MKNHELINKWANRIGDESMLQRESEGVLRPDEVISAMRDSTFGSIGGMPPRYEHFKRSAVCGRHPTSVVITVEDNCALTADKFAAMKRIRDAAQKVHRDAQVIPRRHVGKCSVCSRKLQRKSALVVVVVDGIALCREYRL